MKKFFICIILCVTLSACTDQTIPQIEDRQWEMAFAQSVTADGQIIVYGNRPENQTDRNTVKVLCSAQKGIIILYNLTDGQSHIGSYSFQKRTPDSAIYEITFGDNRGFAVTGMTTYSDGTQDAVLILRIGDYTLQFDAG